MTREVMVGYRADDPRVVMHAITRACRDCGCDVALAASASDVLDRGADVACIDCFSAAIADGGDIEVAAPTGRQLAEIAAYRRRN